MRKGCDICASEPRSRPPSLLDQFDLAALRCAFPDKSKRPAPSMFNPQVLRHLIAMESLFQDPFLMLEHQLCKTCTTGSDPCTCDPECKKCDASTCQCVHRCKDCNAKSCKCLGSLCSGGNTGDGTQLLQHNRPIAGENIPHVEIVTNKDHFEILCEL